MWCLNGSQVSALAMTYQCVKGSQYLFPGTWAITALTPSPRCPMDMHRRQYMSVLALIHQPPNSTSLQLKRIVIGLF